MNPFYVSINRCTVVISVPEGKVYNITTHVYWSSRFGKLASSFRVANHWRKEGRYRNGDNSKYCEVGLMRDPLACNMARRVRARRI